MLDYLLDAELVKTLAERFSENGDISAVGLILIGIHIGLKVAERKRSASSLRPPPESKPPK